jgi:hypothetical protein
VELIEHARRVLFGDLDDLHRLLLLVHAASNEHRIPDANHFKFGSGIQPLQEVFQFGSLIVGSRRTHVDADGVLVILLVDQRDGRRANIQRLQPQLLWTIRGRHAENCRIETID